MASDFPGVVSYDTNKGDSGMTTHNPTRQTYDELDAAFAYFNKELFGDRLPPCLITVRNHRGEYGYFCGERFSSRGGTEITDEIALNPKHFVTRTLEQILSTLVHEMVHLEQHHFGKPSRNCYHNKQWASFMDRVGLTPSSTGEPGGKRTGQKVSHYIVPEGPFACAFATHGPFGDLYFDRAQGRDGARRRDKTKYTCSGCGLNAWAKPDVRIACCECGVVMEAEGAVSYETNNKGDGDVAPPAA
jgi:predicted SprT family Zn-dependent metalloprotease